jgi:VCBS repeat-containing protein
MKQIQYAGYSILKDGTWKFRTATDEKRIFQLEAHGEAVCMTLLPKVVTSKSEAAKQLLAMSHCANDPAIVDFYVQNAKDENPFKRKARVVKVTVPSTAMVQLVGAQVKVSRGVFGKVYPEIPMTPKQAERIRNEFNARAKDLV